MIKLAFSFLKLITFSVIVLLIGQIEIKNQSISNHVKTFTQKPFIQKPIKLIASIFDHTQMQNINLLKNKIDDLKKKHRVDSKMRIDSHADQKDSDSELNNQISAILKTKK